MPSDRNLFLTSSSQRSATIAINSISTQSALPSTAVNTFAILPDSPPQSTSYPLAPSESVAELMRSAIDSIPLVHDAQKLSSLARTVPFFDPAVGFLFQIIKSYTEIKTTNYKRDALLAWVMGITQDLCATIDDMEETKHGDLILCLEPDVKRLARLLGETSKFVAEYDRRGAVRRITARHQLAGRLSALQQEIDSFGPRFRASMITVIKSDFNAQDISLSVEDCRLWEAFRNRLIKHEVQAVLQIETDQFIVRPEDNHKQLVSKGNWEEWISSPGSDSHFQLRRVVLCTIQNACLCYPRPPNYKDSLQCETCQMQCVEESDELLDPLGPQRLPSNDRRDSTESITPVSSISWPEERTARKIQSSTPTPLSLPTSTMFLPTTPPSPGPPFEMPLPVASVTNPSASVVSGPTVVEEISSASLGLPTATTTAQSAGSINVKTTSFTPSPMNSVFTVRRRRSPLRNEHSPASQIQVISPPLEKIDSRRTSQRLAISNMRASVARVGYYLGTIYIFFIAPPFFVHEGDDWSDRRRLVNRLHIFQNWVWAANAALVAIAVALLALSGVASSPVPQSLVILSGIFALFGFMYTVFLAFHIGDQKKEFSNWFHDPRQNLPHRAGSFWNLSIMISLPLTWMAWAFLCLVLCLVFLGGQNFMFDVRSIGTASSDQFLDANNTLVAIAPDSAALKLSQLVIFTLAIVWSSFYTWKIHVEIRHYARTLASGRAPRSGALPMVRPTL